MTTLIDRLLNLGFGVFTQPALRMAQRGESVCRRIQGKGWGGIAAEVRAIAPLLPRAGAVVFDVGANCGDWTRELMVQAGTRVERVFAFEPSQAHAAGLSAIGDARVQVYPLAVSDSAGHAQLFADARGSELASLHRRRLQHFGLQHEAIETVSTVRLDDFTRDNYISEIHFLKMDIEGNELSALKGATELLTQRRIHALSFEFGGCNIDARTFFQDFWYVLTDHGFRIMRIVPGGHLLPVVRYSEDLESFTTTNYVAVLA
jgi:FkbM family methyltransferase